MDNHPEDVPDEILGEIGSELNQARSVPFQPFEIEFKSPRSQGGNDVDFSNASEPMEMITDITEFLNYPSLTSTPKSRAKKSSGPRVLTSAEAIIGRKGKTEEDQAAKELRRRRSNKESRKRFGKLKRN